MKKKYVHHVSYMAKGNTTGVSTVFNDLKEYRTLSEVRDITKFLEETNDMENVIVTNILSFKNI